ncbi:hypothetical protein [Rhodococcus sp. BH5]|uniref:hypothetical protein n=1 Tax=Rhodococcus sp. BH5 TaxID=2871702 RepID=UPI0022CD9209|nr:hypothetical protein [Rhodococcus sp. BH5]MCZ9635168.1 hypothetical protein [Rhodococcus sp. BH5]
MVRRIALAALGVSSIVRGSSYIGPRTPDYTPAQLAFVDHLVPLSWYAIGWIITGILTLSAIGWRALQPAGFAFTIGFNLLWALSYGAAWVFLDVPRGYVEATRYLTVAILALCIAAMIERTRPPKPREEHTCLPSD